MPNLSIPPSAEPFYRSRLKAERWQALYVQILKHITEARRYRDPKCTAMKTAQELDTNVQYVSIAVANATGDNFKALVNGLRLKDACRMLASPRYARLTAEEIGLLAGFSSRQAFYLAFHRHYACTPKQYRARACKGAANETADEGDGGEKQG